MLFTSLPTLSLWTLSSSTGNRLVVAFLLSVSISWLSHDWNIFWINRWLKWFQLFTMFCLPDSVNSHVNYVLTLCSQRIFLLKRLPDQCLNYRQLDTVFQAIVVSRILYALPGWGLFFNKELKGRINAFFKRAYPVSYTHLTLPTKRIV